MRKDEQSKLRGTADRQVELTTQVKAQARALGFDLVGIAAPEPSAYGDFYEDWLARGYAGEMAYLARPEAVAKRRDVRAVLPSVRSVIVVGLNYYASPAEINSHPPSLAGRIARYAWGTDYHGVMEARLKELAHWLQEIGGPKVESKVYVDTGPLLEREWAVRAGLGWFGKNTQVLNQQWGSWFFLGEVLTSLELTPDGPMAAHCGTCTRCLSACPTGALRAPYLLDARRCISYLTIELKGPIPRNLRSQLGNWIFGCDECQEVCPWNQRRARFPAASTFHPRPDLARPDLLELLNLTPAEFNRRFRDSPLRRTKRRGLLRNLCVALGNSGDRRAVPALIRALGDAEPLVRAHAAWALGQLGGSEALTALRRARRGEADPLVREEIAQATKKEIVLDKERSLCYTKARNDRIGRRGP
ncbi:MAG TPA: tRNA epoxyqueuosine(34) reductase QueG [Armatimonadetes bacterium]|nr:tRNA epoxyqueuosine(34) reductase QueG [Armatimonadota bacterium]